ncbi:MAG: hypothetical protein HY748_13040 [Elusimicrobia bacterium]|nr:hypothetical protein [Elusimicrobiota bacterium]
MMDERLKKPLIALLIPVLVIPAIVILIIAAKVLLLGRDDQIPESQALAKLASPRVASVLKSQGPVAVAVRPVMASDSFGSLFVGWGGNIVEARSRQALLSAQDPLLTSFAATPEGLIVTVRGDRLGFVSGGEVKDTVALPSSELRLEKVSDDRLCLFGPVVSTRTWAVYLLSRGGAYSKLFTFPLEIGAVTGADGGIFFAAAGGVYRVEFGKRVAPVLYLPGKPAIVSLAYDVQRRALFLATQDAVYVYLEGRLVKLLDKVSGTLAWRHDGLYILSEARQELLKVDNIFKT